MQLSLDKDDDAPFSPSKPMEVSSCDESASEKLEDLPLKRIMLVDILRPRLSAEFICLMLILLRAVLTLLGFKDSFGQCTRYDSELRATYSHDTSSGLEINPTQETQSQPRLIRDRSFIVNSFFSSPPPTREVNSWGILHPDSKLQVYQ